MYTTCRVGVLSSEISKHSKISPPPSLRSHLTSSPMGVLSGDYGTCNKMEKGWNIHQWLKVSLMQGVMCPISKESLDSHSGLGTPVALVILVPAVSFLLALSQQGRGLQDKLFFQE